MANLKEIRNRITSVSSTMQITSAMKMVSAAKLKRAQDAVDRMMPYSKKLKDILGSLSTSFDAAENIYASDRAIENVVLVPVTSNRGLCGGFNNYVIKETLRLANSTYKGKNVSIVSIGKKATDAFKKSPLFVKDGADLPTDLDDIWNDLNYTNAADIANKLMEAYASKKIDKVVLVYNHSKNVATQVVMTSQLLPVVQEEKAEESTTELDYIFEPSKKEIVAELLPKTLKTQLYSILLESYAGEHGARMTAMHKATDNASELNKSLKLQYNKARQAAITNEILEIVGGAEALNG